MKTLVSRFGWLLGSLLALQTVSCQDTSIEGTDTLCSNTGDTDFDGISDDQECTLGTDPQNPDSDGDGVTDGVEVAYPKICVANDPSLQRRPVVNCEDDLGCTVDEKCKGLDPTKSDSDGDGVADKDEDRDMNGTADPATGETDPRLGDTDGDGTGDKDSGGKICRPDGLAQVTRVPIPNAAFQVGHDPVFGNARTITGTSGRGAVVLDDAASGTTAVVLVRASTGADVRADATKAEADVVGAIGSGVTSLLLGRPVTTHEGAQAVVSSYRIVRTGSSASALRDVLLNPLVGGTAPGGGPVGSSGEFFMDITTVRASSYNQVIVTIGPKTLYEDPTKATAIRANDLYNTSAVAQGSKDLDFSCQGFKASRASIADFMWTVDTSGSMGDDQVRLGNTANKFFTRLQSAGVDFRVGVLQAGSSQLNIDSPGFSFINGTDPNGPKTLCGQVTYQACSTYPGENLRPYYMSGSEEPTAAAVLMFAELKRRAGINEQNINRRLRAGALPVGFFVTDEPGSNDFGRYFQNAKDPDTLAPYGSSYNATTLKNIVAYFKRNNILTFGLVPVRSTACTTADVYDLPRCVIEGNGGASINITTALDAEVAAAMDRIVDAVAGASSQFKLDRTPITSTIKVNVANRDVPRSRSDGFDYDPASKAVMFFGTTYRPKMGDQVIISYRVWKGSVG